MQLKRNSRIGAALLALALPAASWAGELHHAQRPIAGQYIVVLKPILAPLTPQRDVVAIATELALQHGLLIGATYEHALRGFAARGTAQAIQGLLKNPLVAFVEEDGVALANGTQINPTWGLDRSDQRDRPLDLSYTYDNTAPNVHAYIIDTGIRATHIDFGGRVSGGFTSIADGNGTNDCNGHGTHVSGTVAGATYGMAKATMLHPVRVLSCAGSGSISGVIAGVDWVTANHVKPAVANMSLGGGASDALDQAVTNSIGAGVFYSVAAGNDSSDACFQSPARTPAAMTVGATTALDERAFFSNVGTCVDIFAPGLNILSAWSSSDAATNTISGTSMAAPHVAGAAALFLANNPTATPAQVTTALIGGASLDKLTAIGAGSPNRLMYSRFAGGGPVDAPPVPRFSASCTGLTCTFDATTSSDDVGVVAYNWAFGDGTSGTGRITSRNYPASGTYSVTLTVTDTANQTANLTKPVAAGAPVDNPPLASFTFSCNGLVCTFNASGSTDDRGISSYAWAFGDGSAASGVTASRTYATAGSYAVMLTVTDTANQIGQQTKTVTVAAPIDNPPVANFAFVCTGLNCNFDGSASTDDRGIVTYSWQFGDGTTATGVSPAHAYVSGGTYAAALTVRDSAGQSASRSKTVVIAPSNVLQNGIPVSGLAAATGNALNYTMVVPQGQRLDFNISGGSGDADLYVKFGAPPTDASFDCRPYAAGSTETCSFQASQAGTYYVMVRAYSSFSGLTLKGTYTGAAAYYENAADVQILDNDTVESQITVSGASGNAPSALKVGVDIKHTYIGDLRVDLIAPSGNVYVLHNRAGGGTQNLLRDYTIDASAATASGIWRLRVTDYVSGDVGYIDKWSLKL